MKSHSEYVTELYSKNPHFRNGDFELIGEYSGHHNHILIKDKYGICKSLASALLQGVKPSIKVAVDRNSYFINRLKEVHGDIYDYAKVDYIHPHEKITIICRKHGEFQQTANSHFRGSGCNQCGFNKISLKLRKTLEKFKDDSSEIHGDKYSYDKVDYINNNNKVIIVCPIHGEFQQYPRDHLKGKGCYKCGAEQSRKSQLKPHSHFLKEITKVHGERYDYSKVNYMGYYNPIVIGCNKHGEFIQIAGNHLSGQGCPKCNYYCPKTKYNYCEGKEFSCLYLLKLSRDKEIFLKYGLSKNLKKRLSNITNYKIEILDTWCSTCECVLKIEDILDNHFKSTYTPSHHFAGHTETTTLDNLGKIVEIIKENLA